MRKKQTDRDMINEHFSILRKAMVGIDEFIWTEDKIALLGELSDNAIAEKYLLPTKEVSSKRNSLGIKAKRSQIVWTDEALNLLGKSKDDDIAKILGCSRASVYLKKKKLNSRPSQ